ncbi:guanylyl and adenylyl cyclase family member [Haematococcus lacustris]|uniref:Guanylyl and adenylyl cyclase family member n=1 Tax=Haematococcus lacustris TaxID=44745 RepID=A0A699ZHT0_HAELA|nr:guanylyl and adenylyl cyclase family member [Haematococcus lacustris]
MPPTQPRPPAVPGTEGAKLRHAKLSNVLETEAEGGLDVELDRSSCQQQGGFGSSSSSLLVSPQLSRADVMRLSTWHESVSILFTGLHLSRTTSDQQGPIADYSNLLMGCVDLALGLACALGGLGGLNCLLSLGALAALGWEGSGVSQGLAQTDSPGPVPCVAAPAQDIRGFTDMSQQLHPSSVMLFLNHLYSIFDALLETHDVYKIETIGDSYMVVGGLFDRSTPEPSGPAEGMQKQRSSFELGSVLQPFNVECEEHAERSTLAACCQARPNVLGGYDPDHASKVLSFTKAIVAAASQVLTPLGQRVEMRVGIHTGSIMTGVVGRKMPRFCCFGDTVNTASRMESTGVPGCIHVSEAFRDMLPNEGWQPTGGVQVKGKGLMQTYLLNCEARTDASTPQDLTLMTHICNECPQFSDLIVIQSADKHALIEGSGYA